MSHSLHGCQPDEWRIKHIASLRMSIPIGKLDRLNTLTPANAETEIRENGEKTF